MSPEQRALAREALGLPNRTNRSFKNVTGAFRSETARLEALRAMTGDGLARAATESRSVLFFKLTRAGAERALEPGERIDPAHFPPIGQD